MLKSIAYVLLEVAIALIGGYFLGNIFSLSALGLWVIVPVGFAFGYFVPKAITDVIKASK